MGMISHENGPHPTHFTFFAVGNYARAVMAPFHFLSEAPFHNCPTCNYCNQLEWEGEPATWLDRPPQVLMHPTIRRKKFFVTIIVYWQNIKFLAYRLVWFPNPLFQVKWRPCLSIDRQKNCSTYPTEESCGLTNTCTWTTTTTFPGPTTNANPTTTTTTTTRNTTSSCQPGEQVEIVSIHWNCKDFRGCHQSTPTYLWLYPKIPSEMMAALPRKDT